MERMGLGLIFGASGHPKRSFERVSALGIPTCQLACTAEALVDRLDPKALKEASSQAGAEISSLSLVLGGQAFDRWRDPERWGCWTGGTGGRGTGPSGMKHLFERGTRVYGSSYPASRKRPSVVPSPSNVRSTIPSKHKTY